MAKLFPVFIERLSNNCSIRNRRPEQNKILQHWDPRMEYKTENCTKIPDKKKHVPATVLVPEFTPILKVHKTENTASTASRRRKVSFVTDVQEIAQSSSRVELTQTATPIIIDMFAEPTMTPFNVRKIYTVQQFKIK